MTEGYWPTRARNGRPYRIFELLEYLADRPPAPETWTSRGDACLRTHVHVRVAGQKVRHTVIDRWGCYLATACGKVLTVPQVVFTARLPNCLHGGCGVRSGQKHERPVAVDVPLGPLHGVAAKTISGVTLPDNSVGIHTGRDLLRSVKDATDNRVNVLVTAEQAATAGLTDVSSIAQRPPIRRSSRRPLGP